MAAPLESGFVHTGVSVNTNNVSMPDMTKKTRTQICFIFFILGLFQEKGYFFQMVQNCTRGIHV